MKKRSVLLGLLLFTFLLNGCVSDYGKVEIPENSQTVQMDPNNAPQGGEGK